MNIFLMLVLKGVIGPLDWKDISEFPVTSNEYINGKEVWGFSNENGELCNGTGLSGTTFITAYHCATKNILIEKKHICTFLRGDAFRDIAYYSCDTLRFNGVRSSQDVTEDLYVLHYQCDWREDLYCRPTLKYSPGKLLVTNGEEIGYDMDTLPGSSGAGIFNSNHELIGIHHSYSENMKMNYGTRL